MIFLINLIMFGLITALVSFAGLLVFRLTLLERANELTFGPREGYVIAAILCLTGSYLGWFGLFLGGLSFRDALIFPIVFVVALALVFDNAMTIWVKRRAGEDCAILRATGEKVAIVRREVGRVRYQTVDCVMGWAKPEDLQPLLKVL